MTESVAEEILCPICEYDLRGLTEPRCPECGYKFDWSELRDRKRRMHPYLFEHHPESDVRSLIRTFVGGLRPRKFWSVLFPTQPSNPRRLIVYWAVIASVWLLFCAANFGRIALQVDASSRAQRQWMQRQVARSGPAVIIQRYGSLEAWQNRSAPILPSPLVLKWAWNMYSFRPAMLSGFIIVAWPWMTIAALMIFQISMAKAKVKPMHVVRCAIYSADAVGLVLLTMIPPLLSNIRTGPWGNPILSRVDEMQLTSFVLLLVGGVMTYRLWVAYRKYLRFDHALATAAASQVMVGLLVWKLALDWGVLSW